VTEAQSNSSGGGNNNNDTENGGKKRRELIDINVEVDAGSVIIPQEEEQQKLLPLPYFQPNKYSLLYNVTTGPCRPGYYCPFNSSEMPCPPGTYGTIDYAVRPQDCIPCPLGTYSPAYGRSTLCPLCPINSACPNASTLQPCPVHTVSPDGNVNVLDCVCLPDYDCALKKRVVVRMQVVVVAPLQSTEETLAQIQNNTELILGLRQSMAQIRGVNISRVIFRSFKMVVVTQQQK